MDSDPNSAKPSKAPAGPESRDGAQPAAGEQSAGGCPQNEETWLFAGLPASPGAAQYYLTARGSSTGSPRVWPREGGCAAGCPVRAPVGPTHHRLPRRPPPVVSSNGAQPARRPAPLPALAPSGRGVAVLWEYPHDLAPAEDSQDAAWDNRAVGAERPIPLPALPSTARPTRPPTGQHPIQARHIHLFGTATHNRLAHPDHTLRPHPRHTARQPHRLQTQRHTRPSDRQASIRYDRAGDTVSRIAARLAFPARSDRGQGRHQPAISAPQVITIPLPAVRVSKPVGTGNRRANSSAKGYYSTAPNNSPPTGDSGLQLGAPPASATHPLGTFKVLDKIPTPTATLWHREAGGWALLSGPSKRIHGWQALNGWS